MKLRCFLILMVLFTTCLSGAYAADEEVKVFVDGNIVESDVPAVIVNQTAMLPFRAILNAIGISDEHIVWREKSKSIEIKTDDTYIFLAIDSKGALVNKNMIMLNTAPYIQDNRTMIPVRFVSEALGASVDWDNDTRSVIIKTNP